LRATLHTFLLFLASSYHSSSINYNGNNMVRGQQQLTTAASTKVQHSLGTYHGDDPNDDCGDEEMMAFDAFSSRCSESKILVPAHIFCRGLQKVLLKYWYRATLHSSTCCTSTGSGTSTSTSTIIVEHIERNNIRM
jgi:hypothetical protein